MKNEIFFQAITFGIAFSVVQCGYFDKGGLNSQNEVQTLTTNLINITSAHVNYINSKYIAKNTYKVGLERANSTFTRLPLSLDILRNFPSDTTLTTTLLQRDHEHTVASDRIPRTFVSHICNSKDKFREYLPPFLKELTAAGKCIQKGHYSFNDSGQFEFDKLLLPEELKNHYFDTHNLIQTSKEKIISINIMSKSVYTKQ